MDGKCTKTDCTVAATGKCLLLHARPEDCPNYAAETNAPTILQESKAVTETAVDEDIGRRFHTGSELGTDDASELMRAEYATLIAVLGQYDVGKTCLLSSLYLLATCAALGTEIEFAGSLTLAGFEARARRLRQWKDGSLPKQMVDHTILADERAPALMHIAFREREHERRRFQILVTDLPGEWSRELIEDAAVASRFAFLHRADGIVLTLDGPRFASTLRHVEINNANLLLSRLASTIGVDKSIPLVLLVSKADELSLEVPASIEKVEAYAASLGFKPKVIAVAAISRDSGKAQSGTGVLELIEYFLDRHQEPGRLAVTEPPHSGERYFQQVR